MNVEIWTEAALFLFWKYINGTFCSLANLFPFKPGPSTFPLSLYAGKPQLDTGRACSQVQIIDLNIYQQRSPGSSHLGDKVAGSIETGEVRNIAIPYHIYCWYRHSIPMCAPTIGSGGHRYSKIYWLKWYWFTVSLGLKLTQPSNSTPFLWRDTKDFKKCTLMHRYIQYTHKSTYKIDRDKQNNRSLNKQDRSIKES